MNVVAVLTTEGFLRGNDAKVVVTYDVDEEFLFRPVQKKTKIFGRIDKKVSVFHMQIILYSKYVCQRLGFEMVKKFNTLINKTIERAAKKSYNPIERCEFSFYKEENP